MKKILLGILALGLLSAFFSCTRQPEICKIERQQQLIETLSNLNDSLFAAKPETRFTSGFLQFLCVVSADALGGYELGKVGGAIGAACGPQGALIGGGVGGVIGAVGASYGAYCGTKGLQRNPFDFLNKDLMVSTYLYLKQNDQLIKDYQLKSVSINLPEKFKKVADIGAKHNAMLDLAITKKEVVKGLRISLTAEEKRIIESEEYTRNYNLIIPKYIALDVDGYLSGDGLDSKIMKKFLDICSRYPENSEDMNFIINKYIEEIEQAGVLTDHEKQWVYSGLTVAAYSFEYWEENL